MKPGMMVGLGFFAVVVGVIWVLQGLDVLGGSGMSGSGFWETVGWIVAAIGAGMVVVGWRRGTLK